MVNFNKLSSGINISNEIIELDKLIKNSNSSWKEPEWGFPKGRRNLREKDLQCALREFEEETDIKREDIKVIKDRRPFTEEFVGSNNKILFSVPLKSASTTWQSLLNSISRFDLRYCSASTLMP